MLTIIERLLALGWMLTMLTFLGGCIAILVYCVEREGEKWLGIGLVLLAVSLVLFLGIPDGDKVKTWYTGKHNMIEMECGHKALVKCRVSGDTGDVAVYHTPCYTNAMDECRKKYQEICDGY